MPSCPSCRRPLQERERYESGRLACFCGWTEQSPLELAPATEPILPNLQPGPKGRKITVTEEQVESAVMGGFRSYGIPFLESTAKARFQVCTACGALHPHNPQKGRFGGTGSGFSPGIPDTMPYPAWLPPYLLIANELKGTDTKVSEEQKRLAAERRIHICGRKCSSGDEAWMQTVRLLRYLELLTEPTRREYFRDGQWPGLEEL